MQQCANLHIWHEACLARSCGASICRVSHAVGSKPAAEMHVRSPSWIYQVQQFDQANVCRAFGEKEMYLKGVVVSLENPCVSVSYFAVLSASRKRSCGQAHGPTPTWIAALSFAISVIC